MWTPAQYEKLKTWMDANSEAVSSLPDKEVAARYEASGVAVRRPISTADLKHWGLENGVWMSVLSAANDPAHPGRIPSLLCIEYVNDSRFATMDLDKPAVRKMFDGLVATKVLTVEDYAAIDAMGNVEVSQSSIDGAPRPANHGDVAWVRREMMRTNAPEALPSTEAATTEVPANG